MPKLWDPEAALGEAVPDPREALILKRSGSLMEEQRGAYHVWAHGRPSTTQLVENLRRLDRPDVLVASALMSGKWPQHFVTTEAWPPGSGAHEVGDESENVDVFEAMDYFDEWEYGPEVIDDDDGSWLVDVQGEGLVPFDPERTDGEDEAVYLIAYAQSHRQVRGALATSRTGRGFFFPRSKGGGKSFGGKSGRKGKSGSKSLVRAPFKDQVGESEVGA